ncbi:MAG: NfeD family protein [Bacteroidota bacterium]
MKLIKSLINGLFSKGEKEPPNEKSVKSKTKYLNLIGKTGKTLTNLGMTGLVEVEGRKFEAESKSGYIKDNMPVRIVGKHMSWLLVEAL